MAFWVSGRVVDHPVLSGSLVELVGHPVLSGSLVEWWVIQCFRGLW